MLDADQSCCDRSQRAKTKGLASKVLVSRSARAAKIAPRTSRECREHLFPSVSRDPRQPDTGCDPQGHAFADSVFRRQATHRRSRCITTAVFFRRRDRPSGSRHEAASALVNRHYKARFVRENDAAARREDVIKLIARCDRSRARPAWAWHDARDRQCRRSPSLGATSVSMQRLRLHPSAERNCNHALNGRSPSSYLSSVSANCGADRLHGLKGGRAGHGAGNGSGRAVLIFAAGAHTSRSDVVAKRGSVAAAICCPCRAGRPRRCFSSVSARPVDCCCFRTVSRRRQAAILVNKRPPCSR